MNSAEVVKYFYEVVITENRVNPIKPSLNYSFTLFL